MTKPTNEQIATNRKKWLEDLRSGEYEQGKCRLKSIEGRYCCLGVACVSIGLEPVERDGRVAFGRVGAVSLAPSEVVEAMGLYNHQGALFGEGRPLTSLNDTLGYSFNQIADALETGDYWKPLT